MSRLSAVGLQRVRKSIFERQPWRLSTGPASAAGKARAAANGRLDGRLRKARSVADRELEAVFTHLAAMSTNRREIRNELEALPSSKSKRDPPLTFPPSSPWMKNGLENKILTMLESRSGRQVFRG